ncbi:MAG TPA: hypothetical protein VMV18_05225, partial [bacterium]|nr:hypothetical protein [bacterium]
PGGDSLLDAHRVAMYIALGVEQIFQGMGAGALGVLMLRLTSKEFSATQFALLSSLMALPRVIVGPFAGVLAYSLGWSAFFVLTVPIAIPGLVMLHKFVPFGAREAQIHEEHDTPLAPITPAGLAGRGLISFAISLVVAILWSALLGGMADSKSAILKAASFAEVSPLIQANIGKHFQALLAPSSAPEWVDLAGPVVFAVLVAGATAALIAARRGVARQAPAAT